MPKLLRGKPAVSPWENEEWRGMENEVWMLVLAWRGPHETGMEVGVALGVKRVISIELTNEWVKQVSMRMGTVICLAQGMP